MLPDGARTVSAMVENVERNYYLGYAKATLLGLFEPGSIEQALKESWRPGASITRYGRRWHLTKIVAAAEDLDIGRIGFVSDDEVSTLAFDPEINDFVSGEAPSGVVVPFAVRKSDGVIVYQLRLGLVRETTFTGALEELLNSNSLPYEWSIESYVEERSFEEWLGYFPAVTRFDVTLDRPNPNYCGATWVESAVEGTHSESLRLVAKAPEGESLDTASELFQQAVDHVTRNNGQAKIVGHDKEGAESTWVKLRGVAARVAGRRVRRAVGEEEAPVEVLMEAFSAAPSTLDLVNLNARDNEG